MMGSKYVTRNCIMVVNSTIVRLYVRGVNDSDDGGMVEVER